MYHWGIIENLRGGPKVLQKRRSRYSGYRVDDLTSKSRSRLAAGKFGLSRTITGRSGLHKSFRKFFVPPAACLIFFFYPPGVWRLRGNERISSGYLTRTSVYRFCWHTVKRRITVIHTRSLSMTHGLDVPDHPRKSNQSVNGVMHSS